jgi:hypothetical protein
MPKILLLLASPFILIFTFVALGLVLEAIHNFIFGEDLKP